MIAARASSEAPAVEILETAPGDGRGWALFVAAGPSPSGPVLERRLEHFERYGRAAHLVAVDRATQRPLGRITAAVNPRIAPDPDTGGAVGIVGHLQAPPPGPAASALLGRALEVLDELGARLVRGPINLSTWYENRLPVQDHAPAVPPFYGEPAPAPETLRWLSEGGFTVRWRYLSTTVDELLAPLEEWRGARERFQAAGLRVRALAPSRPDDEVGLLYRLSQEAFAGNFSFAGLDPAEFAALYGPLLPALVPELVLFAEDEAGEAVGFCFCLPDPHAPTTLVVKSLGVLPSARRTGAGTTLVAEAHRRAAELGCTRAIHALMNQASHSRRISAHGGRPVREYALYERAL